MAERTQRKRAAKRPLRGLPADTRERLVAAAAELFNRHGYHGTDSNRIANAAGYATGTFYKHFKDKREAFLAAYEKWSAEEWNAVQAEIAEPCSPDQLAGRLVSLAIGFHTKWRGLRASLLELLFTDAKVKRFFCEQRRNQIDLMAALRAAQGWQPRPREDDAVLLYCCDRTYDAIARGELEAIGLDRAMVIEAMVRTVSKALG
ncbi:MAG TPA: TetR/AcrR family transcriptional regulator [Blastocatellia bacterium]